MFNLFQDGRLILKNFSVFIIQDNKHLEVIEFKISLQGLLAKQGER